VSAGRSTLPPQGEISAGRSNTLASAPTNPSQGEVSAGRSIAPPQGEVSAGRSTLPPQGEISAGRSNTLASAMGTGSPGLSARIQHAQGFVGAAQSACDAGDTATGVAKAKQAVNILQ
jgi:hypothetical protein